MGGPSVIDDSLDVNVGRATCIKQSAILGSFSSHTAGWSAQVDGFSIFARPGSLSLNKASTGLLLISFSAQHSRSHSRCGV